MRVVYSLRQSPASHDFTGFLVNAERFRLDNNRSSLHIHICGGDRMITSRDHSYTAERKDFRARTLLTDLCWLLPSVKAVTYSHGDEKQTLHYRPHGEPVTDVKFEASPAARSATAIYLADKPRPVTITVRQSDYQPERNTNLEFVDWLCERLDEDGYSPIIVPDADYCRATGEQQDDIASVYQAAAFSSDMLLALYEQSCMNVIGMQGQCTIAMMSYAPVLFLCEIDNSYPLHSEDQFRRYAYTPSAYWGGRKHIHWCYDRADMVRAVDKVFESPQTPGMEQKEDVFSVQRRIESFA